MSRRITTVIFDMDGVITNTMPYHYRIWSEIFHREGIPVSKYEVYSREGQKGLNSVLEIFAAYGKPIKKARAQELLAEKEILFKKVVRTRYIGGARSFLKNYKAKGLRMALVTGTSRHELEEILPQALRNYFDVIVSGSDVKHGKPHPEPYLKAVRALKIVGEEAVVIENAPFGITSAKKAGLMCWALSTSLPPKYLKEADRIFTGFQQLGRYLDGHISRSS